MQYQLASTALALKQLDKNPCTTVLDEVTEQVAALQSLMKTLEKVLNHEFDGTTLEHARHSRDKIIPAVTAVREVADKLEGMVSDECWPLPTYQEMLFIK